MLPQRHEIIIGGLTAFLIGIVFLFFHITELTEHTFLRLFNGVFIAFAINEVIRINIERQKYSYAANFIAAMRTAMVTVISSVLLLVGFFALFDVSKAVLASALLPVVDQYQFAGLMFIEGVSSSVIITFSLMQYWKNQRYTSRRGVFTKPHQL